MRSEEDDDDDNDDENDGDGEKKSTKEKQITQYLIELGQKQKEEEKFISYFSIS